MVRRVAAIVAIALIAPFLSLAAQAPAGAPNAPRATYVLAGTVVGVGADPLPSAEVTIIEAPSADGGVATTRRVQTDSAGKFAASGLTAATLSIRVRAFGYAPKVTSHVPHPANGRATVTIALEPLAAEISGAEITASGADADSKLVDYYARKSSNGFARFVDGAEIEKRKPPVVSEMLRSVPGVRLTAAGRIGNLLTIRGCAPLIWVDGVRMPGAQLDEVAAPADVAGIEIYNSFAGIPSRYFDRTATCGTILVWLRS